METRRRQYRIVQDEPLTIASPYIVEIKKPLLGYFWTWWITSTYETYGMNQEHRFVTIADAEAHVATLRAADDKRRQYRRDQRELPKVVKTFP